MLASAPEDYGFDAAATREHRCDAVMSDRIERYWDDLATELQTIKPMVRSALEPGPNEIILRSLRDVRIVGRLTLPASDAAGSLIWLHEYESRTSPAEIEHAVDHGVAVLEIWVRGLPPSTQDVSAPAESWIMHRIESPGDWILRGAVADAAQAARWLHGRSPVAPIAFCGESFGGGLAILATSLVERLGVTIDRLAIGTPCLVDWRWRRHKYCQGLGGEIEMWLAALAPAGDDVRILKSLSFFDAAVLASTVTTPTLCKLAMRDDTVPAPAAAAIFNALSGPKYSVEVPYGHFDGGIANARAHHQFSLMASEFLQFNVLPPYFLHRAQS